MDIRLTKKQYEILLVLITGASNKEIANQLYVQKRTVESHVAQLLLITGSKNRSEVISKYFIDPTIFKIYNTKRERSKYLRIIYLYESGKYTMSSIAIMVDSSYNYVNKIINDYQKGLIII